MDDSAEEKTITVTGIARLLFGLNLPLSVVATIIIFFNVFRLVILQNLDDLVIIVGLSIGLVCQVHYYLQMRDPAFGVKKGPWIYSIAVNLIWITIQASWAIAIVRKQDSGIIIPLLLMVYPAFFLTASLLALRLALRARKIAAETARLNAVDPELPEPK